MLDTGNAHRTCSIHYRPKLKVCHMSCLPKHDISSHIWQRIGRNFMQTNEMLPYPTDFLHVYKIQISV